VSGRSSRALIRAATQPREEPSTVAGVRRSHPGVVFAIVGIGVVLATVDQFAVNIAFPAIQRDFDCSLSTLSWVLSAYAITFAALLVPAGRLADRSGRADGFLLGVGVFTIGSALCAAAPGIGWLIAARVVQASGAAALVPCSLGILLAAWPIERRGSAVRWWMALTGSSAALGPVLGGVLVSASWRWIFLVNLPLGVVAVVAGRKLLPRIAPDPGPLPDLAGAAMLAAGIALLSLGVVQGSEWGWSSTAVVGSFAGSAVLIVWLLRRCSRHPSPVVELSLLLVRRFRLAMAALFLNTGAAAMMLLAIFLWAQEVWHWSTIKLGVAYLPAPLVVPFCSYASGKLMRWIGAGWTACLGAVLHAAAAFVAFWRFDAEPDYLTAMLPAVTLTGLGIGVMMPTLMAVGTSALPPDRLSTGSGVLTMGRQVGMSVGVALAVAILATASGAAGQIHAFHQAFLATAAVSGIAAVVSLLFVERVRARVARPATQEA
jgi:EmrB/QacA subfamily drug resistance transporter